MTVADISLLLILGLPFLSFAMLLAAHTSGWRTLALVTPLVSLVLMTLLFIRGEPAALLTVSLWDGVTLGFKTEPLGLIFAMVVSVLWPISIIYSLGYLRVNNMKHRARFCAFFSLAVGATLCIAFANDLLTMLIFYEVLTLGTYPLVTHKKSDETRKGGRVYLAYLLSTSFLLLLPTIAWVYVACGTLTFTPGGFIGGCDSAPNWLLLFFIYGVGKAALMPVHRWLPAAMVAPAPVSALLHAVAVVKSGVFIIVKGVVYVFGYDLLGAMDIDWLVYLSGATILIASVIALRQDNLKRILAYSTIGQLSYIIMGAALLRPALAGAVLHLVAHATAKITLFFAAGAIQSMSGRTTTGELAGIAKAMPWTMTCFAIAAASLVGLPPLGGFVSKWFLVQGMVSPPNLFAIAVIVISTLLNLAYFGRILFASLATPSDGALTTGEAPRSMVFAMVAPTVLVVGFALFSGVLIDMLEGIR